MADVVYQVSCAASSEAVAARLRADLSAAGFPDTETAGGWGELRLTVRTTDPERMSAIRTILTAGGADGITPPGPNEEPRLGRAETRVHPTAGSDTLPAAGLGVWPAPDHDLGGEAG